ncbi:DNA alkylation repair protein [Massilia sp. Root418]|uniref:DNA alkylation repair protein n=1 Tax=Massilia sp. Root418 TaxID=1736532 RepID=UPI0006FA08B1|nr:DNA alkylation repair protein [Massilia sp. Root418]KQX01317.1 DNA alkylation repair protein [Massilia sp. Root418]
MNEHFLQQVQATLLTLANPERANAMRAYMRDQFDYLGVPTPERRSALKPMLQGLKGAGPAQLIALASALWELREREYQYAALDLLNMHSRELNIADIPALLSLVLRKSWWDTVDALATIIGDILKGRHEHMDDAIKHGNFWMRRIALLHQLGWRGNTDSARLYSYCLAQAHEKEFFIQKAIGWALRDYSRHAPDEVRAFTQTNKHILSALSYREANKHL